MKTLFSYFASLLFFVLVLSSCSKDDEVPDRIIIDGTSFKLTNGYIAGYGIEFDDNGNQGSLYDILLTSSGITVDGDNLGGEGQILVMTLFSGSTIELKPGTYDYSDGFIESTLYDAFAADADFDSGTGTGYYTVDGSVTISRSGNTWTIKFDLQMEDDSGNDVVVKGSFSGQLIEVEFD
ncbi:MAG: hypothetical protein HRU69_13395 [Flammeovirgaceae bacterium]|nr:MAG: hypothetical protein HRU69_13395 [Flammeovirgaceae bacterium]